MREQALATARSQSGKSARQETQTNILFFPFIIEYLDFWGFSVGGKKDTQNATYLVQHGC